MRTFPHYREDGFLVAFEVTSAWLVFSPILRILASVPGVTDVRRVWFQDDRATFRFLGLPASVNEPWGDSSRYWIGLQNRLANPDVDISPLHEAFVRYRGLGALQFWPFDGR